MVNLISKISKGTRMDQVYLPKIRPPGFGVGNFVEIIPTRRKKTPFYTHNLNYLEPIKNVIKDELFDYFAEVDNVILTGSFLEKGFNFNDVDVILMGDLKTDSGWEKYFQETLGINIHFTCLDRKSLIKGLKTDPMFQMMMSKYISKKRELFKYQNKFNYKSLDLHLLKSKTLLTSFDILTGKEKYNLVRNLVAIKLFLERKKLNKKLVDKTIEKFFGSEIINQLKENLVEKKQFLKKYKNIYNQTFNQIMKGIKNESK